MNPFGKTSCSGLVSGNGAFIMFRGRLKETARPVWVSIETRIIESVRTPSR